MSATAGLWRQTLAKAGKVRSYAASVASPAHKEETEDSREAQIASLVHQLFFSGARARTRIFFGASGTETALPEFCEHFARVLAAATDKTVALISQGHEEQASTNAKRSVRDMQSLETWCSSASQLTGNLWRVAPDLFRTELELHSEYARIPFDHVICGADVSDRDAPLFARACDGAVLVLTANRTRRDAALRAQEILGGWSVKLLGAVLDNRTFPVPEAIYRRL